MEGSDNHHHHHHAHGHSHTHADHGEQSFTERNRAHWNEKAVDYTTPEFQKQFGDLTNKITAFVLSNISWIGVDFLDPATTFEAQSESDRNTQAQTKNVRVLDYACGPGTMTAALAGYASEYVGIDISEKMVEQYNKRLSPANNTDKDSGNDNESKSLNAHAVTGDLLAGDQPSAQFADPKYFDFDLAVVGLGFHHFENLNEVTRRLVERVKPGGVFMIVEFLPHEKNDMGMDLTHIVTQHGFTDEGVKELFGGAGLVDVDLAVMKEPVLLRGTAWRTPFLARGRKPLQ